MELDQPTVSPTRQYAYCANDHVSISGMKFELCGKLANQHGNGDLDNQKKKIKYFLYRIVYVPFDVKRIAEEMDIKFQIRSNSFAIWNMTVDQIECGHKAALVTTDEKQGLLRFCLFGFFFTSLNILPAPDGCLQYFYQPSGRVESFNFGSQYYGNTHYAICFNRNNNDNAMLEYDSDDSNSLNIYDFCIVG